MTKDKTVTMSRDLADEADLIVAVLAGYPNSIAKSDALRAAMKIKAMLLAAPVVEPQEPVAWTEFDVLDFMSVALRHAEYSGLAPSDILDGLRYMAEKGRPACHALQPAPVAVDAAKAFAKGFNTLETIDGKYKIVMQFAGHDDAFAAYRALSLMTACLDKVKELNKQ